VTPLLGAYIADTYWGRFKTICVAVAIALIGHIVLIVSAVPGVIEHESAVGAFALALVIMGFGLFPWLSYMPAFWREGIGTGLFKANISPLVAEQYKRTKLFVITTKSGERVIVDPQLTVSRIYMVRYLSFWVCKADDLLRSTFIFSLISALSLDRSRWRIRKRLASISTPNVDLTDFLSSSGSIWPIRYQL